MQSTDAKGTEGLKKKPNGQMLTQTEGYAALS